MKRIILFILILAMIVIIACGCSPNKNPGPRVSAGISPGTTQNIRTASPSATLKYIPSPMPTF